MIEDPEQIANHIQNLFSFNFVLQVDGLVEEVIPNLISGNTNNMLTMLPSLDEIQKVVFALNMEPQDQMALELFSTNLLGAL